MAQEDKLSSMGSYDETPDNNPGSQDSSSLAARRARLRGSLSKAALPEEAFVARADKEDLSIEPNPVAQALKALEPSAEASDNSSQVSPAPAWQPEMPPVQPMSVVMPVQPVNQALPLVPPAVLELLGNIDQAMNACALNLAALQKIAGEQTDVMKNLSDTLKNQTLNEIGLNLNSLTESLAAALEPMKAAGELVPAMDQLIAALDAKAAVDQKYSPDKLVMNLADQLSTGSLDPWTFKCAYIAIFPQEHPADLLRRLVELLGTQRLSGDLFRAAYDAVQAAEPPAKILTANSSKPNAGAAGAATAADDPQTKAQLDALRAANEELRKAMEERESSFEQLLAAKDQELHEAQEMLNNRYEEFNTRYAELTEALNKREEEYQSLLDNKEMELSDKESELGLLRRQMEELRSQTEEMVKDLQKQMTDVRIAKEAAAANPTVPAKPATAVGFFDTVPESKSPTSQQEASSSELPQPAAQMSPPTQSSPPAQSSPPVKATLPTQQAAAPPPVQQGKAQRTTGTAQAVSKSVQAAPAPFTAAAGSYGSGVRTQVFEVIVRQALAGAPWREICAGPMQVNNISPEEVEAEVKRRQAMLNK